MIWLTGSLARGDADRWSSVDLHLLWNQSSLVKTASPGPYYSFRNAIEESLGEANVFFEQEVSLERGGLLRGITIGAPSGIDSRDGIGTAGVLFELSWTLSSDEEDVPIQIGATRPLYMAERLDSAISTTPTSKQETIGPPDVQVIERQLGRFWLLLARLPAAVRRQEQLAAYMLLTDIQALLIDLVVNLNGGSRPQTNSRINQFLGPAQREAFEKSLGLRHSGRRKGTGGGAKWIGQAVALVVLYRWYAPQLAEKHSLPYPQMAEDTVLAMLSTELDNWPASIATG